MVTGATSLSLVRDELFATMEQAEQGLEQFIAERQNGSLLQHAVECLQQIRGTLNLIELAGAELLAQEALQLATDIPTGVSEERDGQLAALGNALYVLRRYLENVEANRQEIPELLLPAINEVRCAAGQPALPESFFFSARLDIPRPPSTAIDHLPSEAELGEESRRMRHMYQIGLLGLIREQNLYPSLKLMGRALARLDSLHGGVARSRLCWIGAAAIESIVDGQLLPRKSRKQLFSRIDRELKQLLIGPAYEAPRHLLKELLYLVALSDGQGPRSREVRELHGLAPLPFTDHLLEEESQRLSGPGQSVMRSLSTAIREELAGVKDMLDLIERGVAQPDSLTNLHAQLGKLSKTLGMVGLNSAGTALQTQLPTVAAWAASGVADSPPALLRLADAVLYVESMVGNLERGERRIIRPTPAEPGQEADAFAVHQLAEARIVVIEEAKAGLALAKRAITAYLESNGDKLNLANVPASPAGGPGRSLVPRSGARRAAGRRLRRLHPAAHDRDRADAFGADAGNPRRRPDQSRILSRGRCRAASAGPAGRPRPGQRQRQGARTAGGRLMVGEFRWQAGRPATAQVGGWVLAHCQQRFLQDDNGLLFPREWLKRQELPLLAEHGVGHWQGEPVYVLELDEPIELPGMAWAPLRQFMLHGDFDQFCMLGYASQIGIWARHNRFCGNCGTRMQAQDHERVMQCPQCGLHQYPRLSPSMIVLVTRGDEVLLARSPRFVPGVYSTLAGFVEAGESVEQCVVREVREEVGVEVANLEYIGSQNWPFPHSLMLGFHAEYVSGEIVPQEDEIEDAQWFSLDALPPLPAQRSIARHLIDLYLARRSGAAEPVLPG
ncbi:pilin biosynthetic protein [Pseudomonas aeruginosa]|nr:pilin biosynthetic protein [Pseudomonas aeruginosa]